jgi:membrane protein DedA with SNARE-associated domain
MRETLLQWVAAHGYLGLFSLLVLGIVGLPVPDEWLLTLCGYFVFRQTFRFVPTVTAAFLGSSVGITISYALGRSLGTFLLLKYGRFFRITHHEIDRVHAWFQRIGRWTLTIGYFIPGVRHLTAYVAGATELEIPTFLIFAYSGALIWSVTFISLGYYLGEQWERISQMADRTGFALTAGVVFLIAGYVLITLKRRAQGPDKRQ